MNSELEGLTFYEFGTNCYLLEVDLEASGVDSYKEAEGRRYISNNGRKRASFFEKYLFLRGFIVIMMILLHFSILGYL